MMVKKNDWLTTAAIGLLAMCVVTFDYEALGHGGVCLALGGHIRLLTSSLFRCDLRTGWLDMAGPGSNLFMATLALVCLRFVTVPFPALRLFLITVTAFGYFWEGGYLIRAMHRKDGDLYFAAQYFGGDPGVWQRLLAALAGLILFVFTARLTSNLLLTLWPNAAQASSVARTVWLSATLGAALAALAYQGHGWGDFRDAVLEIGLASFPLLLIPFRSRRTENAPPPALLERSYLTIALAAVVYACRWHPMRRTIFSCSKAICRALTFWKRLLRFCTA